MQQAAGIDCRVALGVHPWWASAVLEGWEQRLRERLLELQRRGYADVKLTGGAASNTATRRNGGGQQHEGGAAGGGAGAAGEWRDGSAAADAPAVAMATCPSDCSNSREKTSILT